MKSKIGIQASNLSEMDLETKTRERVHSEKALDLDEDISIAITISGDDMEEDKALLEGDVADVADACCEDYGCENHDGEDNDDEDHHDEDYDDEDYDDQDCNYEDYDYQDSSSHTIILEAKPVKPKCTYCKTECRRITHFHGLDYYMLFIQIILLLVLHYVYGDFGQGTCAMSTFMLRHNSPELAVAKCAEMSLALVILWIIAVPIILISLFYCCRKLALRYFLGCVMVISGIMGCCALELAYWGHAIEFVFWGIWSCGIVLLVREEVVLWTAEATTYDDWHIACENPHHRLIHLQCCACVILGVQFLVLLGMHHFWAVCPAIIARPKEDFSPEDRSEEVCYTIFGFLMVIWIIGGALGMGAGLDWCCRKLAFRWFAGVITIVVGVFLSFAVGLIYWTYCTRMAMWGIWCWGVGVVVKELMRCTSITGKEQIRRECKFREREKNV